MILLYIIEWLEKTIDFSQPLIKYSFCVFIMCGISLIAFLTYYS